MKKTTFAFAAFAAFAAAAEQEAPSAPPEEVDDEIAFDAGADLRIRQEIMDNVPGLPGGGRLLRAPRSGYRNHVRFRPRVWGEVKFGESLRIYTRLTDEFRWNVRPKNHATTFPDEAIIDNLFIEGTDLFDGFLDFKIGRQDIYNMYGLDHIFVDGTPGDGSRTVYSDVARFALKFDETGKLDLFALHNWDDNPLRWGTRRGHHRSLCGLGGAEPEMDDWGWGAIWSGKISTFLPYQVFAMQKVASSYHLRGEKHPSYRRELVGAKLTPQLTDELSLQLEAMGQVGRNGADEWLSGWSTYAGANWKEKADPGATALFASAGLHFMSGDKNAADEDGGRHAWDPMWSRGVNDSELFLYGTHYGMAWWSNMALLKFEGGIDLGKYHRVAAMTGPMFAMAQDGLGGGDSHFKGLLSHVRYDFPILVQKQGERGLEIFGHLYAELFNPGDYFDTDRPAWFLRWQIDFKF
jgi:hypothetical protein